MSCAAVVSDDQVRAGENSRKRCDIRFGQHSGARQCPVHRIRFVGPRHCDDWYAVGQKLRIQLCKAIPCLELATVESDSDRAEHDILWADIVRGQQMLRMLYNSLAD